MVLKVFLSFPSSEDASLDIVHLVELFFINLSAIQELIC